MARAIERRCIMPPEKPRTIWWARSVSLNFSSSASARLGALFALGSEVGAVEGEDLARGQREIEIRALRHDADQTLDCGLFAARHRGRLSNALPLVGADSRGEDSDGRGLSRAVGT